MFAALTLLAQQDTPKGGPPAGLDQLMFILAIALPFLLFIILPMRREKRMRLEMLSSVERNDKVVINGAILGTVVQVGKPEEKDAGELVVRIDDNVKIRVLRSSITAVEKAKKDSKDGA